MSLSIIRKKLLTTEYRLRSIYIVYICLFLLSLSFLGYFYADIKMVSFFGFGVLCLALGLWKREYMLYLLFLELTLGSFGYLLSFDAKGLNLSLRMLFFVIVMSVWFYDLIKSKLHILDTVFKERKQKISILGLGMFILIWVAGIIRGYLGEQALTDVFFDANSYLYLLLLLPALTYINNEKKFKELVKTVLVGTAVLAIETFALFIVFTKSSNFFFLEVLYKWIRDLRVGELTSLKSGAYRIFIQSQIYLLAGFFLLVVRYLYKDIKFGRLVILLSLFTGAIYISLSRSLWVGLGAGTIVLVATLIIIKYNFLKNRRKLITIIFSVFIGLLLVSLVIPKDASMLGDRFKIGESALSTRVEQLKPLLPAIYENPVFGYGFGKTLTFKSFDPRVTYVLKTGEYTTYAFEWGYLDIILKIGILGFLIYLFFVLSTVWLILKNVKTNPYYLWGLSIMVALLATHIFTPYLNHPLGIGILLLGVLTTSIKFSITD